MYTALRSTSLTLAEVLRKSFRSDDTLRNHFDPSSSGTMDVSLNSPQEMTKGPVSEGLSVWLYRVERDAERLNAMPERISSTQTRRVPLPVRLHYLMTPIVKTKSAASPETEQLIMGKVLQVLHDHPNIKGMDLAGDFAGQTVDLQVRLEPLTLEELSRVYDALERSFQLSVSYEVSVVYIESALEPEAVKPVQVVVPRYALITPAEVGSQ